MDFLSSANQLDPLKTLQYHVFLSNRARNRRQQTVATSKFWLDPKFSSWECAPMPALIWLKGDYNNRVKVQAFAIDIITLLRQQQVPILWSLKLVSTQGASAASMIDLVKGLICQALQLNISLHTESSLALSCARFRAADTIEQWFDLLASTIRSLPLLYIIVDLHALGSSYSHNASWMAHLFAMFNRHSWTTKLKVLLVSYGTAMGEAGKVAQHRDSIVLVHDRGTRSTTSSSRTRPTPHTGKQIDLSSARIGRMLSGRRQPALARRVI